VSSPVVNARIQIADELARLAKQGDSGVLEVGGNPGGTVFLSGGYLAFAESAAVPDLGSRLVGSRRLSPGQWRELADGGPVKGDVGALLVSREMITAGELRALVRSVTLDALIALAAMPSPGALRFRPGRSHWAMSLLRLDVASEWAEAGQQAERLAQRGIPATARPRWRDLGRPGTVVRDGPWMVACQSDGVATAKDLAWRNGLALYEVMDWAGDLVQAGLCSLAAPAIPVASPATSSSVPTIGAARSGERGDDATVPLPLPRREPGATMAGQPADPPSRAQPPGIVPQLPAVTQAPPSDLWHRILKGLRRTE
jgi:hypothetical protein